MEAIQIFIIVILAAIVFCLLFFAIRSIIVPKRIADIQKLLEQGKYAAAEKNAKTILSKEPENFKAHYYLGKAYLLGNKSELALMEYKIVDKTAIFDPEVAEVDFRYQLAELYKKFNQLQPALKQYLLLTKLDPSNAENYFNTGYIYEQGNRADIALGFFQKAIKLNKKHVQAYAHMGLLLYRSKQYKEAKRAIDYAISLSPKTYSIYYYEGKILKENKDYSGAAKVFTKSMRDPEFRQKSFIERGTCYLALESLDNAIPDFVRAIEFDKTQKNRETLYAQYYLASCYEKIRKIDKALIVWENIYAKNHSFKDVAAKITEYKSLQSSDSLKEYLISSDEEFLEICKTITTKGFGFSPQQCTLKKWGCEIIATENKESNWMSVRKQSFLLNFYRDTDPVEDANVRETLDQVKKLNCTKGIFCSSAGFTHTATGFAENRPVELVNKEQLEQILLKTGI